ncbi:pitrilysin family protein [Hydrogenovibrio sp. 3SP14C1]|uniref:M16 family metallopeptidase n=1 Tax=Hydrogenovibrio sp. 3SP14C1 TaxID=3038774 RepID=UPI002416CF55|nr:pitrilysin family protein [Hydrogenovibrio sp. 3SP14C1]MDG4812564.1 pitrilysin family protein [Hydrogenovibrio sp. 3SP14C1]
MKQLVIKLMLLTSGLLLSLQVSATVNIQTWETTKGSKVLYVHAPELPMMDVEVLFDAGSARDGQKWGIASLTAGLIGTATPKHNENSISETFNKLGAQIGSSAGRDTASLHLRTLTRPEILTPALGLMSETLSQAIFRPSILAREKARLLIGLKQKSVQPQAIVSDAMWAKLYGDHPYAHPTVGTIKTVQKITPQQLTDFYHQYYVARNAQVTIVGAVDRTEAEKIAEQLTRNLPSGQKPAALPEPKPLKQAQNVLTRFDSSQTYYALAQLGVKRGDPDYYALFLGNHLLGGSGFGSLLMEEVREKRGLVYGVSSGFFPMKVAGPFQIGLSTKNSTAAEANNVVKKTLSDFMKDFSDQKLAAIKSNLIGGFPLRIDSNSKIAGYISMIGFYNLPLNYLEQFPKKIESISKADILKAWNKKIHPDKLLTVMVGQPDLK